jgi:hypothetical protein
LPSTMRMFNNPDLVSRLLDWPNCLYIGAIIVTLFATFGVVYFGKMTGKLKDAEVHQYQKDADRNIAASRADAASALQRAAEAGLKASTAE